VSALRPRAVAALVLTGAFAILVVLASPGSAASADGGMLLQPTGSVRFDANWDSGLFHLGDTSHTARATILVRAGSVHADDIRGVFSDGTKMPLTVEPAAGVAGTKAFKLSYSAAGKHHSSGTLVLQAEDGAVQVLPFTVRRVLTPFVTFRPVLVAVLIAGGWMFAIHLSIKSRLHGKVSWKRPLAVGDEKWSFSDSWASNLAAVGAILGTILASKDFVVDALSGLSVTAFVGLSLGFGFLAVLAPLAYTALKENATGTYGGLVAASFLTTTAVFGEISTVYLMFDRGGANRAAAFSVFLATGLLILLYVWRSVRALVLPPSTTDAEGRTVTPARQLGRTAPIL
jgi:hypothetical protein